MKAGQGLSRTCPHTPELDSCSAGYTLLCRAEGLNMHSKHSALEVSLGASEGLPCMKVAQKCSGRSSRPQKGALARLKREEVCLEVTSCQQSALGRWQQPWCLEVVL